jgi:hypothetical protein
MNCLECQELIQRCLDGESAVAERDDWAAHLMICPECRDQYAAAECLLEGLCQLPLFRPPAGLLERICRQVVAERVRAARLRRLLAASAMAATFLLACTAMYFGSTRSVTTAEMRTQPVPMQRSDAPLAALSLHRSLQEAGLAVVALTRRTADETMGQTRLLLPASVPQASLGNAQEWEQALERPAQSLREIGESVSAGLEPVAISARRAVGFFYRELPAVEISMQ